MTTQLSPEAAARLAAALQTIYDRPQPAVPWRDGGNLPWDEPGVQRADARRSTSTRATARLPGGSRRSAARSQVMPDWLGLRPGSRLFDVTCGPGLYAAEFGRRGRRRHGHRLRAGLGRAMRANSAAGLPVEIHQGDVREMDFAGAGFDAAIYLYGQFTVLKPEESLDVLRRIHAALRPGAPPAARGPRRRRESTRRTARGGTRTRAGCGAISPSSTSASARGTRNAGRSSSGSTS